MRGSTAVRGAGTKTSKDGQGGIQQSGKVLLDARGHADGT